MGIYALEKFTTFNFFFVKYYFKSSLKNANFHVLRKYLLSPLLDTVDIALPKKEGQKCPSTYRAYVLWFQVIFQLDMLTPFSSKPLV